MRKTFSTTMRRSKFLLLVAVIAVMMGRSDAQDCPLADYTLTTQAEVDNFVANVLNATPCSRITGDLFIGALGGSDINDLSGMLGLTMVEGSLNIRETQLTDLAGLDNLVGVGEDLTIDDNDLLVDVDELAGVNGSLNGVLRIQDNNLFQDVDALTGLTEVGFLFIRDNPSLTSLSGLSGITTVTANISVSENGSLTHLTGLESIQTIGGGIFLIGNDVLTDIDGFSGTAGILQLIDIRDNAALMDIDGLSGITGVTGSVVLEDNPMLSDISGLSNVVSIGGLLRLDNNDVLPNLDGLDNLTDVGNDLIIRDNAILSDIDALTSLTTIGAALLIEENEMLEDLDGLSNLSGSLGSLNLFNNNSLLDVDGLSGVTEVDELFVRANDVLTQVDGFSSISRVNGSTVFMDNGALENLDGLSSLTAIDGTLQVDVNPSLTDLNGLMSLSVVGGDIQIVVNAALTDVSGLCNISTFGGSLFFFTNPQVSVCCCVQPLVNSAGGPITILNNGMGCSSEMEILDLDCGPTSGPNCTDLNLSIDTKDQSCFTLSELLTNAPTSAPADIEIRNDLGVLIGSYTNLMANDEVCIDVCDFLGEKLKVFVRNELGSCWSELTIKEETRKTLHSNLDTVVWCLDPLLAWDPNDLGNLHWYILDSPYTLLPTAIIPCEANVVLEDLEDLNADGEVDERDARDYYQPLFEQCAYHALDWVEAFQCGEHPEELAKIIIRSWEAYDKDGNRSATSDTIKVALIPELNGVNFYVPQKDTVYCETFAIEEVLRDTTEVCWKQLVGVHSDGTYLYYPVSETNAATPTEVLIQRADGTRITVEQLQGGGFTLRTYNGKQSYEVPVFLGDKVRSNGGEFIEVDHKWIYEEGEKGFWVDICVPIIEEEVNRAFCDRWPEWLCEDGVILRLPASPALSDLLSPFRSFCLSQDLLDQTKCFTVLQSEIVELGGSCPRVVKKEFEIKQICASTPVDNFVFQNGLEASRSDAIHPLDSLFPIDPSGIVSIAEDDGIRTIHIEQWKYFIDDIGPIIMDYEDQKVWSTAPTDCHAQVRLPYIELKDECSGVKSVKGTIVDLEDFVDLINFESTYGWVEFEFNELQGRWEHPQTARTFELPCGEYGVVWEYSDSCHNTSRFQWNRSPANGLFTAIIVQDQIAPNVVSNDVMTISLGGKDIWVSAESFDEGSTDNCGIRMILARRTDWATACGVDLCEGDGPASSLTDALNDNEVEEYYLEAYEWLRDDGEFCDGLDNYVIDGWDYEVEKYWAENCGEVDEHDDRLFSARVDVRGTSKGVNRKAGGIENIMPSLKTTISGGWAKDVPFCCEDACTEVTVELLVIDKECNFSKGWVTVEVEDKSPVAEACTFDEVTISCAAYAANYAGFIDAAVAAGNNSDVAPAEFAAVDESLGAILKGWRSDDNTLVDSEGNALNKNWTFQTTECEYVIDEIKTLVTQHDGTVDWVTTFDTSIEIVEGTVTEGIGGVYVLCGARCEQDIWPVLNDCGVGTVTRRWRVYSGCSDEHESTPLVFEQVINVAPTCELKKAMFDVPQDTALTGALSYDEAGNVDIDGGQLVYTLDDLECRNLGIGYEDEVLDVQGQADAYKIHRTWIIKDWCTGEELTCVQKIESTAGQSSVAGNVTGTAVTSYDAGRIGQVDVVANLSNGETLSSMTSANGVFSFDIPVGVSATLSPVKDINLTNGVDITDLVAIKNHVLGRSVLTDQFKQIAADVNNDEVINSKDITAIQSVSLGKTSSFPNNRSWRFFNEVSGEETAAIVGSSEVQSLNFLGVKTGDVDFLDVDLSRASSKVGIVAENVSLAAGQTSIVALTSERALAGYQFALRYDATKMDVVGIQGLEASDWVKVGAGEIRVMSASSIEGLALEVVAKADVSLSEALVLGGSADFAGIAVGVDASVNGVELAFAGVSGFHLYQNTPNPVVSTTAINFSLPSASTATLTFFSVDGKVLRVLSGEYAQGFNSLKVNTADLGVTDGVIYYQLETAANSATGKMVILQ